MIPVILIKHSELHSEILKEREKLNNTKFANQSILIYNRIPKVGFNWVHPTEIRGSGSSLKLGAQNTYSAGQLRRDATT